MRFINIKSYTIAFLLLLLVTIPNKTLVNSSTIERNVKFINRSGARVEVHWVHPDTRELFLLSDPHVVPGADIPLSTFVGHEFEVHELPSTRTGVCKSEEQTCRRSLFTISENDEQIVTILSDFNVTVTDNRVQAQEQASDLMEECKAQFSYVLEEKETDSKQISKAMENLVNCIQNGVAAALEKVNEEISFQASVRKDIARKLENYTCDDDTLDSSTPIVDEIWNNERDGISRTVHVMHRRPASRIHVVEDFISEEECVSVEDQAAKHLRRATVADGKGGSIYSESRKAMQSGITVPWAEEDQGHPIARLSRRVYDYTNHVLGLNIEEYGQEDLMSIQYFGRGFNDTTPDRYTPHCDGDCTGLPHKHGTRMATMVMYCTVPERGGHTNFANSGIHVKPIKGNAVFFSYIDPQKLYMDTGFTEHSGCPVFEGEKKIVTQWIRYGVDAENPWNSFNTLGVKKSEAGEQ